MGHLCRYQFNGFEDEATRQRLLDFLNSRNWDYVGDDIEEAIDLEGSHPYSFEMPRYLKKHGITGRFTIEVWYEEREADETFEYTEASK